MQTRMPREHPVKFITYANNCKHNDSNDRNDDSSMITTESLISGDDSEYHWDFNDECSACALVSISFDAASRPLCYPIDKSDVNDIQNSNLSSPFSHTCCNSNNASRIPNFKSNNEPSSRSDTSTKTTRLLGDLCDTLYLRYINFSVPAVRCIDKYLRWSSNTPPCESTVGICTATSRTLSSVSQYSLYFTKGTSTRLSSTEPRYYHQKHPSLRRSTVQSTNRYSVCSKLSSPCCNHNYRAVTLIESMMVVVEEILCYNIILYMIYLHFMFYKYSLSIAMQGSTTLFSND